jgi:DNA-binding beta-propeller fold protein YncE
MRPSKVSELVVAASPTRVLSGRRPRVRFGPAPVRGRALAACALMLALGATSAYAIFVQLGQFGSAGSGAGQFQTPVGVAVDQTNGDVYVADSGNVRVQKFSATGAFIAAWGYGVTDGTAVSQVCTTTCQAGIPGSGAGQFQNPTSVAVDSSASASSGDVYVGDAGNNVVLKFDTNGHFLATIDGTASPQGHFAVVAGVSVDQSGNLWVADGSSDFISEYDPAGNFVQQWQDPFGQTVAIAVDGNAGFVYLIRGSQATERFTLIGADETVIDSGAGVALGLDPATGNLFVSHSGDVAVYDNTGTQIDSFTLSTSNVQGLGFGTTTGHLYASDETANNVTFYGVPTTPGAPLVQSETATNITETSATLNATIVPFGLDTTCVFQYVDDATFQSSGYGSATTVACVPPDLGSAFNFVAASADISGLTQGTLYHFRAVATNSDGTVNGADKTFLTLGQPSITNESASSVTDTTATLNAMVNPLGFDTTCTFQYVTDAAFQMSQYTTATSVDCSPSDVGSGTTPQTVSANITGLTPGTTYHFRAVATNSAGTTNGADQTFQTLVSFLTQIGAFGSAGSGSGQFQTPLGVAVDQRNGNVYVADSGNARIQKFNAKGGFLAAMGWGVTDGKAMSEVCKNKKKCQAGLPGSGPGQFSNPTSVAVDSSKSKPKGSVYVGDAGNNVVVKLGATGKVLSTITGSITPQGPFLNLAGVAVDQKGNLWTVDGATGNVTEFGSNGNFVQQWNSPSGARAIAVDATTGAVYLINGNGQTQRFTLAGVLGTTVDFNSATALALDPNTGNLYVDHGGNVAVYDKTGTLIATIFSLGGGATTNSQGLAYRATSQSGKQDRLYVSDASNDEVEIYAPQSAGKPFVVSESAIPAGTTSTTLNASIIPLGHTTSCTFQFVSSTDFLMSGYANATSLPCTPASLGSSFLPQQASATATGLTLGAFYHFQVIATNSSGTTTGPDQTFQAGPGLWTPFTRCPVDDPAMLATDGGITTLGLCVASNSSHGSITIGTTNTLTGNTNLQVGVVINETNGGTTVVGSPGGALVADPAQVTVGTITVTATVESAGLPSNFNFIAGIETGVPIITIPIKVHLVSPPGAVVDLGPNCFIGSDQNPILLNPENTDLSNAMTKFEMFDPDGTPDPNGSLETIVVTGAVQGDNTFAVPGAQGCGPNGDGSLDSVVNAVVGLPSPTGTNHLVLDDAGSFIAAPINGQTGVEFSAEWHSVFN